MKPLVFLTAITSIFFISGKSDHNNEKINANIVLVNQDVMYRGVENPVKVEIQNFNSDMVSIECTECVNVIDKGKGLYILRPGVSDQHTVKVYVSDGSEKKEIMHKTYRVKNQPLPHIFFAKKNPGATILKTEIEANMPIIPKIEDFDYDAYAMIKGYTISYFNAKNKFITQTFEGNNISGALAMELKKAASGSKLIFENVKCELNDNTVRNLQAIYTLE